MSEDGSTLDPSILRVVLAAAIEATPGVLRIEPTWSGSLRGSLTPGAASGVTLFQRTGVSGQAELRVRVDVATRVGLSAREVAHAVRGTVVSCLHEAGAAVGAVHVNVLSIETAPD